MDLLRQNSSRVGVCPLDKALLKRYTYTFCEERGMLLYKSQPMRSQEPRSSSSCAACKFMKRRCTPFCLFAPYFQADEPKKFAKVHKVFGASNVTKILNEVPEPQRQDAVNSLVFEAEERLKDPVYGCIGAIASLQDKMFQLQHDLAVARARLARCSSKTSYASCSTTSPSLMLGGDFGLASCDDFVVDQGGLTDEFRQHPFP